MESEELNMAGRNMQAMEPLKDKHVIIRMNEQEKTELKARVAAQGMDMSGYIRLLIKLDKEGRVCRN